MNEQFEINTTTSQELHEVTITTQSFKLTPNAFFRILLRDSFWTLWWVFLFLILVILIYSWDMYSAFVASKGIGGYIFCLIFVSFLGTFLFVWIILINYWRTHHTANHALYTERQITISQNQMTAFQSDKGDLWKYTKDQLYGIEILDKYYLFFVTPQLCTIIPKSTIANEQDRTVLEKEILPAYPKRKRRIWPGLLRSIICLAFVQLLGFLLALLR